MKNMKRLLEFRMPRTGERLSFRTRQYYVSEDGMVYDGTRKRFVAQRDNNYGYMVVDLFDDDGKHHSGIMVHNLVATCFIRLLEKGENVHHRDHDRKNNLLSNLEIIDGGEHIRQHWASGTFERLGEKVSAKLKNVGTSKPAKLVAQIGMNGKLIKVWPSTAEAYRNGWNKGAVAACCRNCYMRPDNSIYKGFRWKYLEDYQKEKEEAQQLELSFSE